MIFVDLISDTTLAIKLELVIWQLKHVIVFNIKIIDFGFS